MAGPPPPQPKSFLGRHRLLAPSASVRVSPLSLGGMSLGEKWNALMGDMSKDGAFELLDTYYELGGNFIDTANAYQGGQSEEWIGEWMQKTGRRDEMVVSTKYTLGYKAGQQVILSNFGGTGSKSLHVSISTSLKRLQTDYIDLLYVHGWDYATQIPELMQSLNSLVQQRKVLYLGISSAPAWVVMKANAYARQFGLRQFSVYQGRLSAMVRDLEREIIPMCIDEGMAIHAWGVLGNGYFRGSDEGAKEGGRSTPFITVGREEAVSAALDRVAKRLGRPLQSVAIAYVMQKAPNVIPLIGGRKVSHLKSNVEALGLTLSAEDVTEIEKAYDFDPGYPHNFVNPKGQVPRGPKDIAFLKSLGHFDYVSQPEPIKISEGTAQQK